MERGQDGAPVNSAQMEEQKMLGQIAAQASGVASGSGWIFTIAALSAVNTVIGLFNIDIGFIFGLGLTQLIDVFGLLIAEGFPDLTLVIRGTATLLSLGIAGVLAVFGYFGRRRMTWAFILVLLGYFVDTGISVFIEDWIGALFHLVALFMIGRGAWSSYQLNKLNNRAINSAGNIHPT